MIEVVLEMTPLVLAGGAVVCLTAYLIRRARDARAWRRYMRRR